MSKKEKGVHLDMDYLDLIEKEAGMPLCPRLFTAREKVKIRKMDHSLKKLLRALLCAAGYALIGGLIYGWVIVVRMASGLPAICTVLQSVCMLVLMFVGSVFCLNAFDALYSGDLYMRKRRKEKDV